ncbi:carboxylate--amine ligase [Ferribacterium limneticum]|uniref:carboxylate--amine ligase n=1 Tax=Ferribacterium limneticum TaxID=76259 RepID=UPI001CF7ED33|nr:hypothetical protein [Ferribacterium limneticum]UCV26666.1 hypothetical protein KI617_10120 [Ferribacterium limneticum]UCV30583.1 hypothetical protein KI608_10120 [Ferribacterium limneticum]
MSIINAKAVVVGSGLNALGIVRSLAKAGIPVVVFGDDEDAAMHTRLARRHRIDSTGGDSVIDALVAFGKSESVKPVLFLTEEKSVTTVSERREEILPWYRLTLPEHELLMALMRKEEFQQYAQNLGYSIPAAEHLRSPVDLGRLSSLRYPCVLKPAVKDYAYGAKFKKAYVVANPDEAVALFNEISPVLSDLIVQEWIEGTDSDIYFCLQYINADQAEVVSFVGRKLRSWPPRIGGTASCVAAPEFHQELAAETTAFFRDVGFVGMGSMEYKRDSRDGRFYMVEPTVGRTDFQEEVATVNGINIPLAAYCRETGMPAPTGNYFQPARIWREPVTDKWSAELQPELGNPPASPLVDAYWRLSDPMPWLELTLGRIKARLASLGIFGRG